MDTGLWSSIWRISAYRTLLVFLRRWCWWLKGEGLNKKGFRCLSSARPEEEAVNGFRVLGLTSKVSQTRRALVKDSYVLPRAINIHFFAVESKKLANTRETNVFSESTRFARQKPMNILFKSITIPSLHSLLSVLR